MTRSARRCGSDKAAPESSSACSSKRRPGLRSCRSRRRCSSAIGLRRTEPGNRRRSRGWPQVQPVQPPPASPEKSEKALIIKVLDLSAADAAGAAGVRAQKISRARRVKKYRNTTYNNNIIIILLEVAEPAEALGTSPEAVRVLDVAPVARPCG